MLTSASLRALRAASGLTQAELSAKAKVSPTLIAEFECGRRDIRCASALQLCKALGVKVVYRMRDGRELSGP